MGIRDFILFGCTDRERLERSVGNRVRSWAEQWLCGEWEAVSAIASPITTDKRAQINQQSPFIVGDVDSAWSAVMLPREQRGRLISAMLTEAEYPEGGLLGVKGESILNGVVIRALGELGKSLGVDDIASTQPNASVGYGNIPKYAAMNGSGAYVISVVLDDLKLNIALSVSLVKRLIYRSRSTSETHEIGDSVEMSTFASVLANRRVRAEALLGSVELSIALLSSLNVGDVIRLDKSVNEPSELLFPGTGVQCNGFIGQTAGKRALSLTKHKSR